MVAPMGAWEDGFAHGWAEAMKALSIGMATGSVGHIPVRTMGRPAVAKAVRGVRRAPSAYNKRLGSALKRLNKRARKKDGSYRKGWNAKKVMRMAHKEAKR